MYLYTHVCIRTRKSIFLAKKITPITPIIYKTYQIRTIEHAYLDEKVYFKHVENNLIAKKHLFATFPSF